MKYVDSGATIEGRHRYLLWREWRGGARRENWRWFGVKDGAGAELGEPMPVLFIMLNPSTADASTDDPTIRRCVAFARAWGYDRLEVANLFAYRCSQPQELLALVDADDPVGSQNLPFVQAAASRSPLIVCAWGAHGSHLGQDQTVLGWLGNSNLVTLGRTKAGHPKHPLYVPAGTPLRPF